jgi:glycosyltransferase involved in cell wall biosynthesis
MPNGSPDICGDLRSVALLLPAWKPEAAFVPMVRTLSEHCFGALIVVDDGSGPAFAATFDALAAVPGVTVLRHAVNLGKGRALKTGFNHLLTELPSIAGVVTADADGQHRAEDIVAVAKALTAEMPAASGGRVVLGVRALDIGVPLRSRIGNTLTRVIFRFVTGARVSDTQTGLRGIPRALLPELMVLDGERYEYEMTMLAHLCRHGRRPLEVPIATVYIDGNRASHFDPIRDSMRIYFVLLRFYFSSLVAAGIDFLGFSVVFAATHNLPLSVAVGRLSSLVNFALNKQFVFNSRRSVVGTLWRYYVLAAAIAGLSYLLIKTAGSYLHWNVFAAKIVVDGLLSLVSFSAQRTFVFRRRDAD